jgi:predicted ATPase
MFSIGGKGGQCNKSPIETIVIAWRCIREAVTATETTRERWSESEINRMAGEIALKSPGPDATKAQTYFERALTVARAQQAKSWELRAAMSMARLWRDQGKRDEARELLAPVYGWFTEGFDTLVTLRNSARIEEKGLSRSRRHLSSVRISSRSRYRRSNRGGFQLSVRPYWHSEP